MTRVRETRRNTPPTGITLGIQWGTDDHKFVFCLNMWEMPWNLEDSFLSSEFMWFLELGLPRPLLGKITLLQFCRERTDLDETLGCLHQKQRLGSFKRPSEVGQIKFPGKPPSKKQLHFTYTVASSNILKSVRRGVASFEWDRLSTSSPTESRLVKIGLAEDGFHNWVAILASKTERILNAWCEMIVLKFILDRFFCRALPYFWRQRPV